MRELLSKFVAVTNGFTPLFVHVSNLIAPYVCLLFWYVLV